MQMVIVSFSAAQQDGEKPGECGGANGEHPALPPSPGTAFTEFTGCEGERKEASTGTSKLC